MAMKFLVNLTATDSPYASFPSNFLQLASGDYFIFSAGSVDVADGQPIPTADQLVRALTILPGAGSLTIAKIFIADVSLSVIREIPLAGRQNTRYVFCTAFDAATVDEPVLELWDTTSYNTTLLQMLGAGTPNNSNIHGIVTTTGAPGSNSWTGKPLAGSADANRLLLNNGSGALVAPGSGLSTDLYFNIYAQVKSSMTTAFENVKFLVHYYQEV